MSGTSADGIDAVLVRSDGTMIEPSGHRLCYPYPAQLTRAVYDARCNAADYLASPGRRTALVNGITDAHAAAVAQLRATAGDPPVNLIGFHGQTVYHNPGQGRTIQLGDADRLARTAGIAVIHDFRAADMRGGGQGAPLAPIYHQLKLRQAGIEMPAAFVNIGGVANASFCDFETLMGFDIGPGNALIDDLCQTFFGRACDTDGEIAASGVVCQPVIERILRDDFFQRSGPRSLDRGYFHRYLDIAEFTCLSPADQIASMTALSAQAICLSLARMPAVPKSVIITGGGAHNQTMMAQINAGLPLGAMMLDAAKSGCDIDFAEAELIALLAARWHYNLASTFPQTTGTNAPCVCGIRAPAPQPV